MKKQHLITLTLATLLVVFSLHVAQAQTSIAERCGTTATAPHCTFNDGKIIINEAVSWILGVMLVLLGALIPFRIVMAYKSYIQGNAGAFKTAKDDILRGLEGFLVVAAVIGGLYLVAMQFLGVDSKFLQLISSAFIPHAYAAGELLPNPLGITSLYDFILVVVKMAMSFFIYPALIAMWVWSGFSYVVAQGNPEAIKKAHQWLLWAVISTIIIFMTQGFLFALRGTVNKILPSSTISNTSNPINTSPAGTNPTVSPAGTADGRVAPQVGADRSSCILANGSYGQMAGGVCYPGRGGTGVVPVSNVSQTNTPGAQANTTTLCSSLTSEVQQMSCFRGKVCNLIISQSEQALCLAIKAQVPFSIYASQNCGLIVSESDRETCKIVQKANK